uniref:Uncharacterized protein n=1 Tax=Oryza rufipogon TaxID=4529 RepID=A0A0E0PH81_ORYRU
MMGLASSRPPLVSAPATATARLPPHRHRRRRLYLSATSCASTNSYSSSVLSHGGTCAPRSLVAAELQSQSRPPPLAAGVSVRGDAATGLAFLLFVLAVALKRLEIAVHKLSKVVAEEVPGTLSSLKLSCLEINDLTSQLKNFRFWSAGVLYWSY